MYTSERKIQRNYFENKEGMTSLDRTCGEAEASQVGQGQVDDEVEHELDGVHPIAGNLGSISPMFYKQILHTKIPKAQRTLMT